MSHIQVRDPIHGFIELDRLETDVIDSVPFQRLREIHQLALSYLVYPGATHKRFEHSLGVLEIATKIFDVVTDGLNVDNRIHEALPGLTSHKTTWKQELRFAALLHDVGHLPFSHAAEGLLPNGQDHEYLSKHLITNGSLKNLLQKISRVTPENVARIATSPDLYPDGPSFEPFEFILNQIITGKAFGADRMDYLLRDSYHAGVAYGRFDLDRIVSEMRLLPRIDPDTNELTGVELGITEGGLHAAEALLVARYQMFSQIYLHRTRRSFDSLLIEFMKEFATANFADGHLTLDESKIINFNDVSITYAMHQASIDTSAPGHAAAVRIVNRKPYKTVWTTANSEHSAARDRSSSDGESLYKELCDDFGVEKLRYSAYPPKRATLDFLVKRRDNEIVSASSCSRMLQSIPEPSCEFIFATDDLQVDEIRTWIKKRAAQH